jgi:hypothetical protein
LARCTTRSHRTLIPTDRTSPRPVGLPRGR